MRGRFGVGGCLVAAAAMGLTACGGGGNGGGGGGKVSGSTLTVYSSLPLQGASRPQSQALVNGMKLAWERAGKKAGKFKINYVSLDDSTAQAGKWDPGQVSANARKAAQDDTTILYLGEFNSGASAISIPILNRAGIGQISPSNTAVGLTSNDPGAEPGEPQKYYPTGKRTYVRVVPKDTIQGAAIATVMKQEGCKKPYILNDKEVYGQGLASNAEQSLKAEGIPALGNEGWDPKAPNYRSVASKIAGKGADCVFLSGITDNNGVQLTKDIAAGVPNAKIYGPDGLCESAWADPKKGGMPTSIDSRVECTVATLDPDKYPPEGKKFFADYKAKYGEANPDPYAIYGYETMSLALDAIERAGDNGGDRAAVIRELFNTKDRQSVLGTYSIDVNGDTSITDYGLYKIDNGQIKFDRVVKAKGASA
ncbi:MAG: branched-chain amino acid ABC transporter substrate-binding protein [Thermoleophilaceae bacterium]|nr:branched-chain amino acid ABC transporter substrate-binding protein [Thermoleophilaceae bacterium]